MERSELRISDAENDTFVTNALYSYFSNVFEVLQDDVLTTAILDRLLYRCEIIKLSGKSYRMKNRMTFLINNKET